MADSCKSSSEDRHVFLFSDLLLLATIVTPNILNRNQRIHLLREVLLAEDIQDTNSWKIVLPGKTRAVPFSLSVLPSCVSRLPGTGAGGWQQGGEEAVAGGAPATAGKKPADQPASHPAPQARVSLGGREEKLDGGRERE